MRIADVTPETLPDFERGLRALAQALGDPFRAETGALEQALFGPSPAGHGLLVHEGDRLCAVALFSPVMSTVFGAPGIFVTDLWVAEAARGSGIGASLLGAIARRGRARWNAVYLRLTAYEANPRSIAFYRRLGFETPTGETALRLSGAAFEDLARTE
jgi:ribosomal protein S18 acetylase RimI-like enzyme